jgi:putative MATE family efflux protein
MLQAGLKEIKMNRQNHVANMGEESITRLLLRFSLPATLAMAVMASYNIIDAIFVGRLGSDAIAALSIAFPMQMLFGALGIGTGVGAASLISRSLGANRTEDAVIAAGQVFLIALTLGIALTLVGFFFLEPLLVFFGATPEILGLTLQYMSVITQGAVLLFLIMMLNHTIRAEGNAMLPMIVMIISAVSNIILDPIFIFVLGMGIRGAAVATVLAKAVGVAILLWYYLSKRSALNLRFSHLKPHCKMIFEIYRVGLPTIFIQISQNIGLIVANRVLGTYGYVAIAAMGLVFRLQMFALMPVIGIAQGLLPIIGFNYGAGKSLRIREAILKGTAASTIIVTVVGLAFFIFPVQFLRVFNSDEALLALGKEAVRIVVLMWPLLSIPLIGGSFFQAIGKGLPALMLSLMRQFIAYIPLLYLMPRLFGLTGIWISSPLADLFTFITAVFLLTREFRRQNIPLTIPANP